MARKTKNHTITTEGRDKGKTFVLKEMAASRAEAWAMRVILALMSGGKPDKDGKRHGVEVPEGFERLGMAAMAEIGLNALGGLDWDVAQPLLAEMFSCVLYMPDPQKSHITRPLVDDGENDDIEEISTRIELRAEVFALHVGFLEAAAPSLFAKFRAAAHQKITPTT